MFLINTEMCMCWLLLILIVSMHGSTMKQNSLSLNCTYKYKVNIFLTLSLKNHLKIILKLSTHFSLKPFAESQFWTSCGLDLWLIYTSGVFTISILGLFSRNKFKTDFSSSCKSWLLCARGKQWWESWYLLLHYLELIRVYSNDQQLKTICTKYHGR